jgi:hypothetical protein
MVDGGLSIPTREQKRGAMDDDDHPDDGLEKLTVFLAFF